MSRCLSNGGEKSYRPTCRLPSINSAHSLGESSTPPCVPRRYTGANWPRSNRLAHTTNPVPSKCSVLMRLRSRLMKTNKSPLNTCRCIDSVTNALSVLNDLRMSVGSLCTHTHSARLSPYTAPSSAKRLAQRSTPRCASRLDRASSTDSAVLASPLLKNAACSPHDTTAAASRL